jgi:hypothetical protein
MPLVQRLAALAGGVQVRAHALAVATLQHWRHQGSTDALALPARRNPEDLQVVVRPVRVMSFDELADPEEAGRVGSCQRFDPPAQLLGVLAADRDRCPSCRYRARGRP